MKRKSGFTLIELIIVITIIGVLAAIAIPRLQTYRTLAKSRKEISDAQTLYKAVQAYDTKNNISIENAHTELYYNAVDGSTPLSAYIDIPIKMEVGSHFVDKPGEFAIQILPDVETAMTFDQLFTHNIFYYDSRMENLPSPWSSYPTATAIVRGRAVMAYYPKVDPVTYRMTYITVDEFLEMVENSEQ